MDAIEGEVGAATDISPVVAEYEKWKEYGNKFALDQALHPAVLNNIPWEEETPRKIAEFALETTKEKSLHWIDDRKGLFHLEQSDKYKKVHEVRREIRNILRREKIGKIGG